MDGNPNITFVKSVDQAQYLFYCAWGDGRDLYADMEQCVSTGLRCIFHITGDLCYVKDDEHIYFVTNLLDGASCEQYQVPYAYDGDMFISDEERPYLASFMGSMDTNPSRERLMQYAGRDGMYIERTSFWPSGPEERAVLIEKHQALLKKSMYTLCPRGAGPSSIRIMEAMLNGSVPIIIDDKTRPFGDPIYFAPRCSYDELDNTLRMLEMDKWAWPTRVAAMRRFVTSKLLIDETAGHPTALRHSDYVLSKLK